MSIKLPPLAQIAKEAGDEILKLQEMIAAEYKTTDGQNPRSGTENIHYKDDLSPFTTADTRAHEIVVAALSKHFPSVAVLSEEATEQENAIALKARDRFETDPLDNTTGYIKGKDGWSVNIGRIVDGVPTEGVIYFPAKQELYFTGEDGKAYLRQGDSPPREISVKKGALRNPLKVAVGFNEQNIEHLGSRQIVAEKHAAQQRTCMVATGAYDITGVNKGANGGFNSYDIAGPHAVLRAAGGEIVTMDKKPLRYSGESLKVPDHCAGGIDTLVALGLADKELVKTGQKIG